MLGRPPGASTFLCTPDASWGPATEGNVAFGGVGGLAAAIRRQFPWRIALSYSRLGAASFSADLIVEPSAAWSGLGLPPTVQVIMSDPFVAYDPASRRYHFIALEATMAGDDTSCSFVSPRKQVLVYRTATDPETLAAPVPSLDGDNPATFDCDGNGGACVVGARNRFGRLLTSADHGALVLSRRGSGVVATPHVVLWDGAGVYHWWKPEGQPPRIVALGAQRGADDGTLELHPPTAFVDAAGDVYAVTFSYAPGGTIDYPTLCRLLPGAGTCDPAAVGQLIPGSSPPRPYTPLVHFSGGGTSGNFETAEPFSFAAHPTIPGRLYAVFQGRDASSGQGRVYFTMHRQRNRLGRWTEPLAILPSAPGGSGDWLYFDQEVSVSRDGTLVVTFSGAPLIGSTPPTVSATAPVRIFVAVSTDEGASFTVHPYPTWLVSWRPAELPFHCSRGRHFLGEYRRPAALLGRHFHPLPRSRGGAPVHWTGTFVSRWAVSTY